MLPIWIPLATAVAAAPLSPDRRGEAVPERSFDVLTYHLDVDLALEGRVSGSVTLTARRLWEGPLVLDQVDLDIAAVTLGAAEATWRTEGDHLVIDLPDGVAPRGGDPVEVTIRYAAEPDAGLHLRRAERRGPDAADEFWTQGQQSWHRHWLPAWDHPNDRFDFTASVRAPEGMTVVTNSGQTVPTYLIMVAASDYEEVAHPEHPELLQYVPRGTSRRAVERVMDPLPAMMEHFAARTGLAYPWGPYRQVFVQRFQYGAMENTSATIFGARFLADERVDDTRPYIERVVAHELAHQWFGDWVTCLSWRDLWLNEGFATFMTNEWDRHQYGEHAYADRMIGAMNSARGGPPMAKRFHGEDDAPVSHKVYVRGASVLHMLRVMLGEEAFWQGVQTYLADNGPGSVETIDLQRAFEVHTGRHLGWFFQQWVELAHTPALTVRQRWADGTLTVTVTQKAKEDQPLFTLPLEVEVGRADGTTETLRGWLEDDKVQLSVPLREAPAWVAFDPRRGLIATVDRKQDDAAWEAQLRQSTQPFAQREAVTALADTDASDALLAVAADAQRPLDLRRACVRALGQQRVGPPLLPLLEDPHGRIRQAVVEALGKTLDPGAPVALQRVVQRDPNPDVQAEALQALAQLHPEDAVRLARGLLTLRESETDGIRAAATRVLGEHGEARDLGLLLDPTAPRWLPRDISTAAARLVRRQEPGKARDKMRERVARYADDRLADLDIRTRQTMVGVLGQIGDEQSVALLARLAREDNTPLADRARAAIRDIRARKDDTPDRPSETEARLEALEEKLEALEKDVKSLDDRI